MKRNIVIAAIAVFGLGNSARAIGNAEEGLVEERSATTGIAGETAFLEDYFTIKDALVKDDYQQVRETAVEMQKSLKEAVIDEEKVSALNDVTGELIEAADLKAQRKAFAELSQQLYQLISNTDIGSSTFYWQHCPMALGQGANWLSLEKQVRNPYMGQKMPGCGSVEEKIEN